MTYVFDTNAFTTLFRNYYKSRFPSLWNKFDLLVESGEITSTREVRREIESSNILPMLEWAKKNRSVFPSPNASEGLFVKEIFAVRHFQQIIEKRKLYKGGNNADPFIIARAASLDGCVVTLEGKPKNGAKIPNVCEHFNINCISLESFMENEGWRF